LKVFILTTWTKFIQTCFKIFNPGLEQM
jgi:hypothetical protein